MSEEDKYEVPQNIRDAVRIALASCLVSEQAKYWADLACESFARELAENPIAPNEEQMGKLYADMSKVPDGRLTQRSVIEWQRRMFLKPEVPEAIRHLMTVPEEVEQGITWTNEGHDIAVLEAYRLGLKAANGS